MYNYIAILLGLHMVSAAPPLKLTIDCGSHETDTPDIFKPNGFPNRIDADSICSIFRKALPKSINDGQLILIGQPTDQSLASSDQQPITIPPPRGFIPKTRLKVPKIKVPKFKVPRLNSVGTFPAPRVGAPMLFPLRARERDVESSAERMEKFKKGVQKMLHVVKILGQIDQYVSERARIIVDILSKAVKEKDDYTKLNINGYNY